MMLCEFTGCRIHFNQQLWITQEGENFCVKFRRTDTGATLAPVRVFGPDTRLYSELNAAIRQS